MVICRAIKKIPLRDTQKYAFTINLLCEQQRVKKFAIHRLKNRNCRKMKSERESHFNGCVAIN